MESGCSDFLASMVLLSDILHARGEMTTGREDFTGEERKEEKEEESRRKKEEKKEKGSEAIGRGRGKKKMKNGGTEIKKK